MTSRRLGLSIISCLAGLDVWSQPAVAVAQASVRQQLATHPPSSHLVIGSTSSEISPLTSASAVLAPGSQGAQVVELQKTLRLLGYFDGKVTGVYEATTAAAVGKFQQAVSLQRSTVAQVPAAAKPQPAQKPTMGILIWLYSLGGIVAVAAGVALLRLSGRSRAAAWQPATSGTTTVTAVAGGGGEDLPQSGLADLKATPNIATNGQATPPNGATTNGQEPNGDRAMPLRAPEHAPKSVPVSPNAVPQMVGNSHTTAKTTPELSVSPSKNSSQPMPPNQLPTSHSTASQALTLESPPLSETTRMAKSNIVDELMQDLRSSDAAKRHQVIWELSHRGDSRAVQPLVDLLIDSDSQQRNLILSALSEIGTRTLRPMSRALAISLQDDNADVRKNAIRDLTRVYDMVAQISQLLHKATDDPDAEVQETARWALGQLNRIRSVPETDWPALKNSVSPPESLP
jgi:peptidoglycan hydrolase-like protein with peptidoglycan-binding domain